MVVGHDGRIARVIAAIGSVYRIAQPGPFVEWTKLPWGRWGYMPGVSIGDLEAGEVGRNDREGGGRSCDLEGRSQGPNTIMIGPVRAY